MKQTLTLTQSLTKLKNSDFKDTGLHFFLNTLTSETLLLTL